MIGASVGVARPGVSQDPEPRLLGRPCYWSGDEEMIRIVAGQYLGGRADGVVIRRVRTQPAESQLVFGLEPEVLFHRSEVAKSNQGNNKSKLYFDRFILS